MNGLNTKWCSLEKDTAFIVQLKSCVADFLAGEFHDFNLNTDKSALLQSPACHGCTANFSTFAQHSVLIK